MLKKRSFSHSGELLTERRIVEPSALTRATVLKIAKEFADDPLVRTFHFRRLILAANEFDAHNIYRTSPYAPYGLPLPLAHFEGMNAAQVLGVGANLTASIKIGRSVEVIDLTGQRADRIERLGSGCVLSGFVSGNDSANFYCRCPILPTDERAIAVLSELRDITETNQTFLAVRTDFLFGPINGPLFDLFRAPVPAFDDAVKDAPMILCHVPGRWQPKAECRHETYRDPKFVNRKNLM